MRTTARPRCALCGARADVHCQADAAFLCAPCDAEADAAFLCAPCDAEVHGANLLASRHRRTRIPPRNDARVSARRMGLEDAGAARLRPAAANDVRARCGSTLQVWARRMGLDAGAACVCAAAAGRTVWVDFAAVAPRIPLRVAMAASLWREVAAHAAGHEPGYALQRLVAQTCRRVCLWRRRR
uniref:Zinc finger protein CONSTANS-LIKE 1 n=1 Tax=Aegilops tauschii TaxID=37682 RepID=R7VZE8_AEGTA